MFLSESIMRAIHADRVREIERSTRQRRLVEAARDDESTSGSDRARWLAPGAAARQDRTRLPA